MEKEVFGSRMPGSPVSPALKIGNMLFISGQVSVDKKANKTVGDDIAAQTKVVLQNIEELLKEAGSSLDKVASTTVYLSRGEDFQKMNEVYSTYFQINPPARTTVKVDSIFPKFLIEISAIAYY